MSETSCLWYYGAEMSVVAASRLSPVFRWSKRLILLGALGFGLWTAWPSLFESRSFEWSFSRAVQAVTFSDGAGKVKTLKPDAGAQLILDNYSRSGGVLHGIVVMDLHRGREAAVDATKVFTSASLYKLFVAERLYELRKQGKLEFTKRITISSKAASIDAGTLSWAIGSQVTVSECLRQMVVVSDNTCGVLLGDLVNWKESTKRLHELGYVQTDLVRLQTSARDVAVLLRSISEGRMVDEGSSKELERLLFAQRINTRLPALLPRGVIGHKTGDLEGLAHDAGIVEAGGKTYVIAVLSGPWPRIDQANSSIATLSKQVYDYMLAPSVRG